MKSSLSQLCLVSLLTFNVLCQTIIDTNDTIYTKDTLIEPSSYNFSAKATGYRVNGNIQQLQSGLQIPLLANSNVNLHGNLIRDLLVDVSYETTERLHVKIYDKERKQVEVPDSPLGLERPNLLAGKRNSIRPGNNYQFNYTSDPFSFQVLKSNGDVIFDTKEYPLVFEDQYLEISTHLPNTSNIYGFGENTSPFKRTRNITTLFNRDSAEGYNSNQYSSHPFYIDYRNGSAHGTFLLNGHGMDIVTELDRITFKVIGGVLDFYFFVPQDSKPNSVVQSYTTLVGKPIMPSQWMLGVHHYGSSNVSQMRDVMDAYHRQRIPLEALWLDMDVTTNKNFAIDGLDEMTSFSQELHKRGHRLVARVDPSIPIQKNDSAYERGSNISVYIKNQDESDYICETAAGARVLFDWWHPNITEYWDQRIATWMGLLKLDGVWLSMNEPSCLGVSNDTSRKDTKHNATYMSNDTFTLEFDLQQFNMTNAVLKNHNLLYPGYTINNGAGSLSTGTVSMVAQHYGNQSHYDLHNLYGLAESYITRNSILKYNSTVRPLLLTRSTFAGSGKYTAHWTGDNSATWPNLKSSISSILNMQIFGVPFTGVDICGHNDDDDTTTFDEELCTRWLQLGAFYPLARIHTTTASTGLWRSNTMAQVARQSMSIRYSLLPYLYTLFEEANRLGTGVWRPLIFEFPHSSILAGNCEQFMIGTDILVSPVTKQNAITVEAQFPSDSIWYDYYNLSRVINATLDDNSVVTIDAPLTSIPLHIRGGAILPTKSSTTALSTAADTVTPYNLIIALDDNAQAAGRLYIDDGISLHPTNKSNINFIYTNSALTVNGQFAYADAQVIQNITLLGQVDALHNATVNENIFNITKVDEFIYTIVNAAIPLANGFVMNFV
ncbi:glycoside hydrolase family 31 protein [Backusella circina FSU 941]|nr:glycoside hydrolase family 31 protein [Backusella circina FSU 941]